MAALDDAMALLRAHLNEGPVARTDIQDAAKRAKIAKATLRRAKERLHIESFKVGIDPGRWYWKLPPLHCDRLSTSGRSTVWLVTEAMAAKKARRGKPVPVPGDPGGWVAS